MKKINISSLALLAALCTNSIFGASSEGDGPAQSHSRPASPVRPPIEVKTVKELEGFTFSSRSEEDKPLFPHKILSVNGILLNKFLRTKVIPMGLWSLVMNLDGEERDLLQQLKICPLKDEHVWRAFHEIGSQFQGIGSRFRGVYWYDEEYGLHPYSLMFYANDKTPTPCILPLFAQLTGLKMLKANNRELNMGRGEPLLDTSSLFGTDITKFSTALSHLTKLEVIDIHPTSFLQIKTRDEAEILAKAFQGMSQLKELSLFKGSLGDEGMQALAPVLSTLQNLTQLHLFDMNIRSEGVKSLIDHPNLLSRLHELDLSLNPMGEDAVKKLVENIASNKNLKRLFLKAPNGGDIPTSPETEEYVRSLFQDKNKRIEMLLI